jgi:hypothetical protein
MGRKDRIRQTSPRAAASNSSVPTQRGESAFELAAMIGNSGVQQVAHSPALRRSPAAAALLARSPSPRRLDDEDIEYPGAGTTFDEWLWEQQGWAEQQKRRADEAEEWIIEHANDVSSGDDATSLAEEAERLRRQGVVNPPFGPGAGY